jgi:hypothetical protein
MLMTWQISQGIYLVLNGPKSMFVNPFCSIYYAIILLFLDFEDLTCVAIAYFFLFNFLKYIPEVILSVDLNLHIFLNFAIFNLRLNFLLLSYELILSLKILFFRNFFFLNNINWQNLGAGIYILSVTHVF